MLAMSILLNGRILALALISSADGTVASVTEAAPQVMVLPSLSIFALSKLMASAVKPPGSRGWALVMKTVGMVADSPSSPVILRLVMVTSSPAALALS